MLLRVAPGDVAGVTAAFADDISWTEADGKATTFLQHVDTLKVSEQI